MKAVVYRKKQGLVFEEVPAPKPDADQVLIRVANTGFCGSDHSIVEHDYVDDGHILGHELSGTVAEIGADAKGCAVGDRVIVRTTFCGECPECLAGRTPLCQVYRRNVGTGDMQGGFAEYLVAYPQMLIPIPEGAGSRNAATAEMYATSYHAVRTCGVDEGPVLVLGGGPIGLTLIQLLKAKGFKDIVLADPIEAKQQLGLDLGVDRTVDPLSVDMVAFSREVTNDLGFNVVFECSGIPGNVQLAIECASVSGYVSLVSMILGEVSIQPMTINYRREIHLVGSWSSSAEDNAACLDLMASGQIDPTPLISDYIELEQLPEVYRERIHPGKSVKVLVKIGDEF